MSIPSKLADFDYINPTPLSPCRGWSREADHHFNEEQALAVLAAFHINRPLLVRGEPGVGKSQLARAVSAKFELPLVYIVANERMEPDDILWSFDELARLSDVNRGKTKPAFVTNNNEKTSSEGSPTEGFSGIDNKDYLSAGPLWWAFDPESANRYEGSRSYAPEPTADVSKPFVLLIDEIDKADRSVPNSLLESLGNMSFRVPYVNDIGHGSNEVKLHDKASRSPIIIITSNDEQELPPAFVRRCLVLDLKLPTDEEEFVLHLKKRAISRFGEDFKKHDLPFEKFAEVASSLFQARTNYSGGSRPGQAEYFDHLEAIIALRNVDGSETDIDKIIDDLAKLTYSK